MTTRANDITFQGFFVDLVPITQAVRETGILDLLVCLGWMLVISISARERERFNVLQLLRCPGRLSIEGVDITHCLAVRIFISRLGSLQSIGPHPVIRVRIKFWSSWIWEGIWDPESDFSVIRTAWKDVMLNLVWTGTFASSFMVTMPTLSGPFPNLWLLMMLLRVLSRFSWPLA